MRIVRSREVAAAEWLLSEATVKWLNHGHGYQMLEPA